MIILEGPDGAGKTFTAQKMSSLLGKKIFHFGGPPKDSKELFRRLYQMLENDRSLIYDRCSIISEPIYGDIIRGVNLFGDDWNKWRTTLFEIDVVIVYCRPSNETILKTKLESKPHKSIEHVEEVIQNIQKIIVAYDKMMLNFNVTYFNRDTTTVGELCAALIS